MKEHDDDTKQLLLERTQTLATSAEQGVLGTLDDDGYPYTSLVELLFDGDRHFWLLLSDLAVHSDNIRRDRRASLLISDDVEDSETQTLQTARATFLGEVLEMDDRRSEVEERYLELHPEAEQFIDFSDFHFYRMSIQRARMVAGFGKVGWIDVDEFAGRGAGS